MQHLHKNGGGAAWSYHITGALLRLIFFICHSFRNSSAERSQQGFACSYISIAHPASGGTFNRGSHLGPDCRSKIPIWRGLRTESSVQCGNFLPFLPPPMQIAHGNVQMDVAAPRLHPTPHPSLTPPPPHPPSPPPNS